MFNLLIGGAAGQGIETTGGVFEKYLKNNGFNTFSTKDVMSRVRGGHNFTTMRISRRPVKTHDYKVDGILAMNQNSIDYHIDQLNENGFVLADEGYESNDPRVIFLPMNDIAKDIGNIRVASSVAVGALIKLFDLPRDRMAELFALSLREDLVDINVQAAERGYELITDEQAEHTQKLLSLDREEQADYSDWLVMNGNNALALGAMAAGLKFYSAYPMSPATSVLETLATYMDDAGIVVEQAEDELAGINMAVGASYGGAVAMTGTSGGGFTLKIEGITQAGMQEVPVVIVDAMRPGPVTGLPTRTEQGDLNMAIFSGNGEFPKAVIAIKNHEDAFYQAARALNLAEKYQMPVILLTDQYLADGTATIPRFDLSRITKVEPGATPEEALSYREGYERSSDKMGETPEKDLAESEYKRYRLTDSGISPRLIPGNPYAFVSVDTDEHDEYGFITESAEVRVAQMDKRARKMDKYIADDLQEPEQLGTEDSEILLIAWGSLQGAMIEAAEKLDAQGIPVNILIFGDVWPLPQKTIREAAKSSRHIINVEQNFSGQLGSLILRETGIAMTDSILKYDGRPISSDEIVEQVSGIVQNSGGNS